MQMHKSNNIVLVLQQGLLMSICTGNMQCYCIFSSTYTNGRQRTMALMVQPLMLVIINGPPWLWSHSQGELHNGNVIYRYV